MPPTRRAVSKTLIAALVPTSLAGCSSREQASSTTTTTTTPLPDTVEGPPVRIIDSGLTLTAGVATVSVTVTNIGQGTAETTVDVTLTVEGGDQQQATNALSIHPGGTRTVEFDFDVAEGRTRDALSFDASLA